MDLIFADDPLAGVRPLYRRAYLAHLNDEPAVVQSQLASLLRDRLAQVAATADDVINQVFAEERRRVDDARVVREMIVFPLNSGLRAERAKPALSFEPTPETNLSATPSPVDAGSPGSSTPAIADLLDGMLRQDAARRVRGARAD